LYILTGEVLFDNFSGAFIFWLKNPYETYGYTFIFSLTGYLGINIVLHLVKQFGALNAVTVTTCRKAVTIGLSFIFFTKPFSLQYLWSGLLVLVGIYLNLLSKNHDKFEANLNYYFNRIFSFQYKKSSSKNQLSDSYV